MVNFVAYRQVDINELGHLGHQVDTGPAVISGQSSTHFVIHQGEDPYVDFIATGANIQYVNAGGQGVPFKGSVTHLMIQVDGVDAYEVGGGSLSVAKLLDLYLNDDATAFAAFVLAKNDQITGSDFGDQLAGFNGNDAVHGGGGDDVISGGKGNDTIHGGDGNDTLTGDAGKDQFVFDTAPNDTSNVDTVTDFDARRDIIVLDRSIFDALAVAGKLPADALALASQANLASQHVIYDSATGNVFYDADGSGGGDQVQIAKLDPGLSLSAKNFLVVG